MANRESGESEDVAKKLRGDAVGDTMYSERWILRVLIRVTKYLSGEGEFDSDFEAELCTLWDMCTEKDVVLFLRKHGIVSLVVNTVVKTEKPRLNEIMIGILGNLCAVKNVREECEQRHDVMKMLLDILSLIDAPTLIQVMRILQTFAWDVNNTCDSLPLPQEANNESNNHVNNHHEEPEQHEEPGEFDFENFLVEPDGEGLEPPNVPGDADSSSTLSDDAGENNHHVLPGLLCINNEDSLLSLGSGGGLSFGDDDDFGILGGINTGLEGCSGETQPDACSISSGTESTVSQPEDYGYIPGIAGEAMSLVEDQAVAGPSSEGAGCSERPPEPSTSGEGNAVEAAGKASTDEEEDAEVVNVPSNSEKETMTSCDLWYQLFLNLSAWLPEVRFILNSSKNDELLCATWSLLQTVCFIRVRDTFLFSSILGADVMRCLLESHNEFFGHMINEAAHEVVKVERCRKGALVWTSIMYAFTLHPDCLEVLCQFKGVVMRRVFQVLKYYHQYLPLDDDLLEYVVHSHAILRHILMARPTDIRCLRAGVFDTIHLLDELTASKNEKIQNNGNVTREREAMCNVQRYLRIVLDFTLDVLEGEGAASPEQELLLKEINIALSAKDLVYY